MVVRTLARIRKSFNRLDQTLPGEATDPHEDKAARAHLEGAEPTDLLDDELGPQRFGARFRERERGD